MQLENEVLYSALKASTSIKATFLSPKTVAVAQESPIGPKVLFFKQSVMQFGSLRRPWGISSSILSFFLHEERNSEWRSHPCWVTLKVRAEARTHILTA